jgi:hypothetical protein
MILIAIILVLNALIPTKAWRIGGVPIGEGMTLVIYAVSIMRILLRPRERYHPLLIALGSCVGVVLIAALHGYLTADDIQYWFWNAKQAIHYLFIFALLAYLL